MTREDIKDLIGVTANAVGALFVIFTILAAPAYALDKHYCLKTLPRETGVQTKYVWGSCYVKPAEKWVPVEVWRHER